MKSIIQALRNVHGDESGHTAVGFAGFVGAVGAVLLGVGVAADSDILAIVAGVVLGLGVFGASLAEHMTVDYDIYARLEKLEGKK